MDDLLLEVHHLRDIDDEEFIMLYDLNRQVNLHGNLLYWHYDKFDLEQMSEGECLVEFRFSDLQRIYLRVDTSITVDCCLQAEKHARNLSLKLDLLMFQLSC